MKQIFIGKANLGKLIPTFIWVFLFTIFILLNSDGESVGYIIYSLTLIYISILFLFLIGIKIGKKRIFIINFYLFYSIPYKNIVSVGFCSYKMPKSVRFIDTILITYTKRNKLKEAHIFYKLYKKSDLINLMKLLNEKNNQIDSIDDMGQRMHKIHESPRNKQIY